MPTDAELRAYLQRLAARIDPAGVPMLPTSGDPAVDAELRRYVTHLMERLDPHGPPSPSAPPPRRRAASAAGSVAVSVFPPAFPPTWTVPTPVLQRRTTSTANAITRVTWQYDPPRRDFLIDGAGRTPLTTADEAAIDWAAKTVTTQKGQHIIYSRSYGVDIRRSLKAGSRAAIEAALTAEFKRAAKQDIRIADLDSFQFRWYTNIVRIAYRCLLANGRSKQTFISIPRA